MSELISVLVPIYGIEKYIGKCVESLINQTYDNLEIILVDDGSVDNSGKIIDEYAKKDNRINVIHKKNGGLVSARKVGLSAAKGNIIGYVDGDDWVEPTFFETLYSALEKADADIVVAGHSRDFFDATEKFISNIPVGTYSGTELEELRMKMLSDGAFFKPGISTYLWNKLFRKEVIYDAQMRVDERISIGEDAAAVYPAIEVSKCVTIIDDTTYHYRQREDSMLKKRTNYEDELRKLKVLYDYMRTFEYKNQVDDFILGKCMMLSCSNLPKAKIAIYSAGSYGQQLVSSINETTRCELIAWADNDYAHYQKAGLNVVPVEKLVDYEFDYLYIASLDPGVIKQTRKCLIDFGIEGSKIISAQVDSDRSGQIRKYFASIMPGTEIKFLGQAGFEIKSKDGKKLGIDYYLSDCVERIENDQTGFSRQQSTPLSPKDVECDVLIATHAHGDHYDYDAIPIILRNGKTKLYSSESCELGIKVKPGDVISDNGFNISFVHCDHGAAAPDALGVIVEVDGKRILDVGDTCLRLDYVDEYLSRGPIDVLIGPINGAFGNMNKEEFEQLAMAISPKLSIPCHCGMFKAHGGNAKRVPSIGEVFTIF